MGSLRVHALEHNGHPPFFVVEFCFPLTNARFGDFKDVSTSLPCVFVVLASWSPLQTRTARLRGLPSNEIDPNFDLPLEKLFPRKAFDNLHLVVII